MSALRLPRDFGRKLRLAVGAKLRLARESRGLSQDDVALLINSHRAIVSRTERGVHAQGLHVVALHAHAVGLPLSAIGLLVYRTMRGLEPYTAKVSKAQRRVSARAHWQVHRASKVLDAWRAA